MHGIGAFVVDGLQAEVGHEFEGTDNLLQVECHAFGLGLHHGGVTVDVDDEASKSVALRVDEAEAVGMRVVGQAHDFAYLKGMVKAVEEKPFVDFGVFETQNLHGDAVRLAEARAEDVAVVVGDGDRVARLQAFGGIMDSTRKHPRMEATQGIVLARIEAYDGIKRVLWHISNVFWRKDSELLKWWFGYLL